VVAVDQDEQVHFAVLPGSLEKNEERAAPYLDAVPVLVGDGAGNR
jgi:hypothetical protein